MCHERSRPRMLYFAGVKPISRRQQVIFLIVFAVPIFNLLFLGAIYHTPCAYPRSFSSGVYSWRHIFSPQQSSPLHRSSAPPNDSDCCSTLLSVRTNCACECQNRRLALVRPSILNLSHRRLRPYVLVKSRNTKEQIWTVRGLTAHPTCPISPSAILPPRTQPMNSALKEALNVIHHRRQRKLGQH